VDSVGAADYGLVRSRWVSRPARIDAKRMESLSVLPVSSLLQLLTTKANSMSGKNLTVARDGHRNGAVSMEDQCAQSGQARDAEEERGTRAKMAETQPVGEGLYGHDWQVLIGKLALNQWMWRRAPYQTMEAWQLDCPSRRSEAQIEASEEAKTR
jgi:hypothetical protein